jgi:predicted nucleic acid-binding protein
MRKILLDINVILDILLDRKPHVTASAVVWTAIETGQARGWVPAQGVTTSFVCEIIGNVTAPTSSHPGSAAPECPAYPNRL